MRVEHEVVKKCNWSHQKMREAIIVTTKYNKDHSEAKRMLSNALRIKLRGKPLSLSTILGDGFKTAPVNVNRFHGVFARCIWIIRGFSRRVDEMITNMIIDDGTTVNRWLDEILFLLFRICRPLRPSRHALNSPTLPVSRSCLPVRSSHSVTSRPSPLHLPMSNEVSQVVFFLLVSLPFPHYFSLLSTLQSPRPLLVQKLYYYYLLSNH